VPLTIASYSFDDPSYACARLRVVEPVRALGKAVRLLFGVVPRGAGHIVRGDIAAEADVLLVQRVFPCAQTAPLLETLFASGKPVIYDTDDDWTSLPASHPFAPDMAVRLPHILDTVRRASLVTVSTPPLAATFGAHASRVRVVPNLLPGTLWRPYPPPDQPVVAVGLAATPSHQADWAPLETALARLTDQLPGPTRWVFYGCPPTPGLFPRATVLPFTTDYVAYAARLPRLGLAIGLAPLADTPFNRAKSPIKWMEFANCGLAGIFADLPPYQAVVEQERTGLLVGPAPEDWCEALTRLVRDAPFRRRLAEQAGETVRTKHRLDTKAECYLDAWETALGGRS